VVTSSQCCGGRKSQDDRPRGLSPARQALYCSIRSRVWPGRARRGNPPQ
jgi:hypothetical protein